MTIRITTKTNLQGSYSKTVAFLARMRRREQFRSLHKYGAMGVAALQNATPTDSGITAHSWYYEIVEKPGSFSIHWLNSNVQEPGRIPVAVLIQYGHGTGNGGFVQGTDYINPAMKPIFDQIATQVWKEVTK